MANSFQFELVSPERLLLSGQVAHVVLPGAEGDMTVMANHAPLMTTIRPGFVTVKSTEGREDRFVVLGGFADIAADGCTLLAEYATPVDAFNKDELTKRIEAARAAADAARTDDEKLSAESFLHQLTTLEGAIIPA